MGWGGAIPPPPLSTLELIIKMTTILSFSSSKLPEAKSEVPDWGIKSTRHRVKVDSGIRSPMVYMLESTLEWT